MTSSMIRKINGMLKTQYIGKVIHYQDELGSTNEMLMDLGEKGASEGTVVIADRQTAGKGRLERKWISPGGSNLYISILFRPEIAASDSPVFTLLASLAVRKIIEKAGVAEPRIKWPNDIQIDRRKVAGVLTEMQMRREMADCIVIGIGVNINMTRDQMNDQMGEVALIATSIKENLGKDIDRGKFAADLLLELEKQYQEFKEKGKKYLVNSWIENWGDYNKRVLVKIDGESVFEGIAIGIDEVGYLLVKRDDGEVSKIVTGDVTAI